MFNVQRSTFNPKRHMHIPTTTPPRIRNPPALFNPPFQTSPNHIPLRNVYPKSDVTVCEYVEEACFREG